MLRLKRDIIPVLLGGDLNAYSVALAFREAFGVSSHVFSRYRCGATDKSNFIKVHLCSELDDVEVAVSELLKFASENTGYDLFLIPCADVYVSVVERSKALLSGIYKIHVPDILTWRTLSDKKTFYEQMKREGILFPEYISFDFYSGVKKEELTHFDYPAVLKPSDSAEYWQHPFDGMRKVYFPKSAGEASGIIYKIFESGYRKNVILQRPVEGEMNYVFTTFSDNSGRVVRGVLGKVILEETGKTSMGNHSAIITIPPDKICYQLVDFLNKIGYRGIANVDIMYDGKNKYALELNPRQGRSCDYLRAAGVNIAELFVKCAYGEKIEPSFSYKEIYWHYPPHKEVMKYTEDGEKRKAEYLSLKGEDYTPYINGFEGVKRKIYVTVHNLRLSNAFRKNRAEK